MKYYFELDGKVFGNVSDLVVKPSYRSESKLQNLAGGLLIDRTGTEKSEISVKLNMLSADDMAFLRQERKKTSTSCKYYQDNELVGKTVFLDEFEEPAPIYHYGKRENGLTYLTLDIKLSEV